MADPTDSAARRAAKRVGLVATKSRCRRSGDNYGGFMLVNPFTNTVVGGVRYELSTQKVLDFCAAARWERIGSPSVRVYCGQTVRATA
jgi:hypothetical protein